MSAGSAVPVISFVGKSGVGKTTVLERVIREIKQRGYRVGTIKHDTHGFEIDRPGKDTWRHAQAGSDSVVISGPRKMALIRQLSEELTVEEILPMMGELDLVITEGYKTGSRPKVEITRQERSTDLLCIPEELVAIMADYSVDLPVPQFSLEDAIGIVDLLEELYLQSAERL